MWRCQRSLTLFCAALLFTLWQSSPVVRAAKDDAKKEESKVAGILIDKKDDWLTVKADGEEEPVKYLISKDSGKKLADALKTIFNASRVELTYKQDGDSRQLVSIKKQILRASGTVTGVVVKVYNDFWVEVKPKDGVADAYAPGANYNDKNFMAKLRGLKPGDSVTITFNTDFERHRILSMQTNAATAPDDKNKPKQEGYVMGLIIDKKDNMMTVKADGETEAVKYYIPDGAEKKMVDAFKGLFTVSRVELKYKLNGDKRELTAFRRHIPGNKLTGTITGEVVENHDW
jgi:hypothetical protein